jgi:hypothetical protein
LARIVEIRRSIRIERALRATPLVYPDFIYNRDWLGLRLRYRFRDLYTDGLWTLHLGGLRGGLSLRHDDRRSDEHRSSPALRVFGRMRMVREIRGRFNRFTGEYTLDSLRKRGESERLSSIISVYLSSQNHPDPEDIQFMGTRTTERLLIQYLTDAALGQPKGISDSRVRYLRLVVAVSAMIENDC